MFLNLLFSSKVNFKVSLLVHLKARSPDLRVQHSNGIRKDSFMDNLNSSSGVLNSSR